MSDDHVLYDKDGPIITLTLNRPDELNAFSDAPMIEAFLDALARIRTEKDARCVILTGAGRAFSAGGNVKHMRDKTGMFSGSADDIERAYTNGIHKVPLSFWTLEVPVIGAVNGPAYGAALDLVCMCDIRIASETASFGAPFVKIGIAPGDGAAWFLSRIVGPSAAAEMILTGEPISAETAQQIGLVSRVEASGALLSTARTIATKIAANAPQATRLSKQLLRLQDQQSLQQHLALCAQYQGVLHGTNDHHEAISALLEKRIPDFSNT